MGKKKISDFDNKPTPDNGDLFLIQEVSTGACFNVTKAQLAAILGGNQTFAQVLANGNNTGNLDITSINGESIARISNSQSSLIKTDGTYNSIIRALSSLAIISYDDGVSKTGEVSVSGNSAYINHTDAIELVAPSVTKNGVEIVTVNDLPNFEGLKSGGTITVGTFGGSGTNNDIRVSAASWVVGTTYYSTASNTDFLDIALSSAGLQRYIGLYGTTSNTITKVEGSEAALATYPTTPANTIVIGYVLVNDASASSTPDLSGYMLKVDKATAASNITGTNDTTYVTPLANAIKENKANKGVANGYAGLDGTGKVPSSQLPSYVDDVLEFSNVAAFPSTGESGKIYIDLTTNFQYRWSGSAYIQITSTSALWGSITGALSAQSDLIAALATKQDTLVSGTNIRTINGSPVLGSGDLTIDTNSASNLFNYYYFF